MSAFALPTSAPESIQAQRERRAARSRRESRARMRARAEPFALFVLTTAVLAALGVRDTVTLHLVYPDALTRLAHAYISWWNDPPRFRAIGFVYPPLQSVVLLPFALLRPLATSLAALPVFSALCGGVVIAMLGRTLAALGLAWWVRLPMLAAFLVNPLFLDYASNGTATCLVMALLAAGLHNFCVWYVRGANSVRSLGFCGSWLAIGFLARYETLLWLTLVVVAVALVRARRGASLAEIVALETILVAPFVYIFLIWSAVSMVVGGGGPLSWITRAGAEHVNGLTYQGRLTSASRVEGVVAVVWHTSPLLLIVPAALMLTAVLMRRPILLAAAATVLVGAGVAVLRMWLLPNAELLAPAYEMVALVPMLIGSGWLISLLPDGRTAIGRLSRGLGTLLVLGGLAASLATAYTLMRHDANQYDRAFTQSLASHLRRITPAGARVPLDSPGALYRDDAALATFLAAGVDTSHTVLIDDFAFPGLILASDTTVPYRTRAANGDPPWERILANPWQPGKVSYMVVANPKLTIPRYPGDLISQRYPTAYSGRLAHTMVIYRNPLMAVVQLLPRHTRSIASALLPSSYAEVLALYRDLPELSEQPAFGAGR